MTTDIDEARNWLGREICREICAHRTLAPPAALHVVLFQTGKLSDVGCLAAMSGLIQDCRVPVRILYHSGIAVIFVAKPAGMDVATVISARRMVAG